MSRRPVVTLACLGDGDDWRGGRQRGRQGDAGYLGGHAGERLGEVEGGYGPCVGTTGGGATCSEATNNTQDLRGLN